MAEYLEENKKRDFEECDEKQKKYHIYNDAVIVLEWLEEESE